MLIGEHGKPTGSALTRGRVTYQETNGWQVGVVVFPEREDGALELDIASFETAST